MQIDTLAAGRRGFRTFGALAATLAALGAVASSPAGAQDLGIRVGAKAPTAILETMEGAPADLGQWIGKTPVLLEFWATWCGNCRQLEPALKAAFDEYGDRVRFIGIAVSVNQSRERVRRHLAGHAMPLHAMLYDPDADASEAFETPATSYVVIINADGTVAYTGLGGKQELAAALGKVVAR